MMPHNKIAGVVDWNALISVATPNFNNTTTPAQIISRIILIAFPLMGALMLAYLVYGGYIWMFSSGDPNKVAHAQKIITTAIIGFIIIFASFWIVQFVGVVFGLEPITEIFGS